jgi:hypothetical protein
MIHRAFLASLVHPAASLLYFILPAWRVTKWVAWARWPAWVMAAAVGAITALLTAPAQAGWFWGPDPKVEAANRALERAAQIATEAARTHSGQQSQLLAAIEALSSERTQIAGQFGRLGEMAARDSAWAAALQQPGLCSSPWWFWPLAVLPSGWSPARATTTANWQLCSWTKSRAPALAAFSGSPAKALFSHAQAREHVASSTTTKTVPTNPSKNRRCPSST